MAIFDGMVSNAKPDPWARIPITLKDVRMAARRIADLKMPTDVPNPADVHPQTYDQIKKMLTAQPPSWGVEGSSLFLLTLHQRTDVEPGYLHPCTCKEEK